MTNNEELRRAVHERNGMDRVTTMALGRSDAAVSGALVCVSLEGPVGLRDLVRRVVDAVGLRIESVHGSAP